ncbi:ATP-binding protein [Salinibius halmophilus]|uniref:GHKL domain-containing protein n=1 Tax=Salinibius halmophilus TaxID=1853216 RepID=UPI000E669ED4|nr:GHKL domain-containing protein [Salinibius halmophilus]
MAKHRRRKGIDPIDALIMSSNNSGMARYKYFSEQSDLDVGRNIQKVANHRFFRPMLKTRLSDDLCDAFDERLPKTNFSHALYWSISRLELEKSKIDKYIQDNIILGKIILTGDIPEALNQLERNSHDYSGSFWYTTTRNSLLDESEKSNPCKERTLQHVVLKNFHKLSNEEEIFISSERRFKNDIIRNANPNIREYLLFHLFSLDIYRNNDLSKVLILDGGNSVFDLFNSITSIITIIFSQATNTELKKYKIASKILNRSIHLPIFSNFHTNITNCTKDVLIEDNNIELYDLYNEGKFKKICSIANSKGLHNYNFHDYITIVKSDIREETLIKKGLIGDITGKIKSIITNSVDSEKAYQNLVSLCYKYRTIIWFQCLNLFLQTKKPYIKKDSRDQARRAFHLWNGSANPERMEIFDREAAESILGKITSHSKYGSAVSIYKYTNGPTKKFTNTRVSESFRQYFYGKNLFSNGRYSQSENIFLNLEKSDDKYLRAKARYFRTESLIKQKKTEKVLSIFLDSYFSDESSSDLDIENIKNLALESYKSSSSIDYPIFLRVYSELSGGSHLEDLRYSFEVFLSKNNARFPTDLFQQEAGFGKRRLNYFFEYVCIPEIMKLHLEFDNLLHIEDCRVEICQHLIRKEGNKEKLSSEIRNINKSRTIKRAQEKVDNSRIFVETPNLEGRNSDQYRDLFGHFLNHEEDRLWHIEEKTYNELKSIIEEKTSTEILSDSSFAKSVSIIYPVDLILSKRSSIFLSLLKMVRDEFALGESGLNNHLSTRIRHGVLPTTLRNSFISEGLYISPKKDELSKKWKIECKNDKVQLEKIVSLIRSFSKKVDEVISELNDSWLQIQIDVDLSGDNKFTKKSTGLFKYSISPIEPMYVQKMLPPSPSYDDFVATAINWLWLKTEWNLKEVRESLFSKSYPQMKLLLTNLKSDITTYGITTELQYELSNSIDRTIVHLHSQYELVSSWFHRSELADDEDFELFVATDISANSLAIGYNHKIEGNIPRLNMRKLSSFVDIFGILFENALSKSGIPRDELKISCFIKNLEETLTIRVENNIAPNTINKNDISFILEAYGDESIAQTTQSYEGGTGFFKLWKIIQKDLNIDHELDIQYDNNSFSVEISMHKHKGGWTQ